MTGINEVTGLCWKETTMELCASYLTLCGSAFGELPKHGLGEIAQAAFRAGYHSIGMSNTQVCPGLTHSSALAVPVREMEWADITQPDWESLTALLKQADRLGTVRRLNVGSCSRETSGTEATNLRTIARMAEDHGITVMVEPVAFGSFATVDSILALMGDAGGENMRLLYDTWHVWRSENKLPFVDASAIGSIQISGSYAWPYILDDREAAMDRSLPGNGIEGDTLPSFLAMVLLDGYDGVIGVEMPNLAIRRNKVDCQKVARLTYDAMAEVLSNAQG